mmetsp:Transcript_7613/g.28535  ORF Transcript_7613/g.28535 Transcript_7613/m.28535 type:complete len:436 (-) Transcript_7613:59-1366(-)
MELKSLPSSIRKNLVMSSSLGKSARSHKSSLSSRKAKCVIGMQMPNGQRHRMECVVSDTLWHVLKQLERQENVNVTRASDGTVYFMPQLSSMKSEYKTWDDMRTTLRKVGLKRGDNALLRLTFVPVGKLSDVESQINALDANVQEQEGSLDQNTQAQTLADVAAPVASQKTQDEDPMDISEESVVSTTTQNTTTTTTTTTTEAPVSAPPNDVVIPVENLAAQEVKLFRIGTGRSDTLEDISDADFQLRASELRMMMSEITKRQKQRDVLLPSKYREQGKKKRRYDQALIRVRFPQGFILQGTFKPSHKLKRVHQMIQAILKDPQTPFYVYTAPPVRRYESLDSSLQELDMVPASILNISAMSGSLEIREDIIQRYCQNLTDQIIPQDQNREQIKQQKRQSSISSSGGRTTGGSSQGDNSDRAKQMPKWFKMGFKK